MPRRAEGRRDEITAKGADIIGQRQPDRVVLETIAEYCTTICCECKPIEQEITQGGTGAID
jgi:hypothetical protein